MEGISRLLLLLIFSFHSLSFSWQETPDNNAKETSAKKSKAGGGKKKK